MLEGRSACKDKTVPKNDFGCATFKFLIFLSNDIVTSHHNHLIVKDGRENQIFTQTIGLVAGRPAPYNRYRIWIVDTRKKKSREKRSRLMMFSKNSNLLFYKFSSHAGKTDKTCSKENHRSWFGRRTNFHKPILCFTLRQETCGR